jgi:hydroxymethylpyrimidine/phosphomethylpyrimidine kinase
MRPPTTLTIAGSDSGGGAGIQADLKTFFDHGVYGMSVVVGVTAQNTRGVDAVHLCPPDIVAAQIRAVLADLPVDAIKIGMLGAAPQIEAVADVLAGYRGPIVLDPVMVAKGGAPLLQPDAVAALRAFAPRCTLLTPNLPEAEVLGPIDAATLTKDGHGSGDEVVDVLTAGGARHVFRHPRQVSRNTHGTGCTLSSAIAARLARGEGLVEACGGAIAYVAALIAYSTESLGGGHGPLLHGKLARTKA